MRGNNKQTGGTKPALPAHVILCLVHRILWQRISNLVNKFALLLHKYRFTQDSRDKPENDGCWGRWFGVFTTSAFSVILRRYSLPEVPRRRIHNVIAYAMSICVAFSNKVMDTPELPQPIKRHVAPKYDIRCGASGKSMIEMLGVLAIIAVLSVGGIAGYSKAMQKWEDNKQIQQLGELFYNSINLQDSLFQEYQKKPGRDYSNGINILEAIGQIPNDMKRNGSALYDRYGNSFLFTYGVSTCRQSDGSLALCNYTFSTGYYIRLKQNGNKFNLNSERQCRNILKVAAAFDNEVSYIESRNKDNNINGYKISNVIYGKTRCVKDALCFSNLKPIDATNFCKSCSTETCEFILSFVGVK